jgi:hypothetical protein
MPGISISPAPLSGAGDNKDKICVKDVFQNTSKFQSATISTKLIFRRFST